MRILSGLQPSGRLHIGNYFGMMEAALKLQHEGEAFYFIADYHSLTSIHEGKTLRSNVRDLAIDFLACGLDPEKCVFFRQSDVPEHTELSWILSTVTPMGLLERCHSYKDKVANGIKPSHGLFAYPVLMAADILMYDADLVPVGKDQKQHVEVTRDIAIKMNETFGQDLLKLPTPRIREETAVVQGTDGRKMSKSYGNTIQLFEEPGKLKKAIMGIPTDSTPVESPKPIEGSSILALYQLVASPADYEAMVADFQAGGKGYGDFKKRLLQGITDYFAPFREKRAELVANPEYVNKVLAEGAEKARAVARKTLDRVRQAVGLGD
ncbi:tryptophan--tRNA ligase [Prosthecobacter dejongeii]|uniref:Tryptophan--tRNA ligase n=1 Tax=Prosthecobacter dejongeii TaxID=48465 RepID=A0A7W7YHS3_9BACT|nr:tryptophan--tRNA ligase [Prosthecobacter dejongeii]MBB5036446.1 tryptophanyl-tRNA synthetase [Prosthecobacter dejongeii]